MVGPLAITAEFPPDGRMLTRRWGADCWAVRFTNGMGLKPPGPMANPLAKRMEGVNFCSGLLRSASWPTWQVKRFSGARRNGLSGSGDSALLIPPF